MSANAQADSAGRWRGLPLALALGLLMLAQSLGELQAHYAGMLNSRISRAGADAILHSPLLLRAVGAFAAAQVLLHLLLGLAAWLAARLTARTWPALRARPWLLLLAWFAALYVAVGLGNAVLYPWSVTAAWARVVLHVVPGAVWLPAAMATLMATIIAVQLGLLLWHSRWRRLGIRVLVWGGLVWLVAAVHANLPRPEPTPGGAPRRPNVVFIGIDSLRPDLVGTSAKPGFTPNLSAFLQDGQVFGDVTTPLARTFPSWIALLTGRSPERTGVRENLLPRSAFHTGPTLADRLRRAGYRTVFATDEVRFSNIDASYGFDQTITPRIGTTDFVLGALNDMPLSNLFANTRVAKWLFPDTYGNRAAAVTYDPQVFVTRVDAELAAGPGPLFFASHLTLSHWPYHWAADENAVFARTSDQTYAYLAAVVEADRQFGQLLAVLERKGVLDDAIVVVFSDHGEGLGAPEDNLVYSPQAKAAVGHLLVWMNGHGTSVLSPMQYHIVLGVRGFGNAVIKAPPGVYDSDALCIEDIAPTMSELLGLPAAAREFDGLSFAARLTSGADAPPVGLTRVRYTESAYTPRVLGRGDTKEEDLVGETDTFYRVNRTTGRFETDMSRWSELLAAKERAAFSRRLLLAATPGVRAGTFNYIAVPLGGGLPRRLLQAPGAGDDAELRTLWSALHAHFPGELGPAAQE
jgi:arylsulfatase A-like enzyme